MPVQPTAKLLPAAPPALSWSDWPARRQPGRAVLVAVLLGAATAVVASVDHLLAVLGGALLLGATSEILLPTHYRVDATGITTRRALRTRQLAWDRVAALRPHDDGIAVQAAGARRWLARRHDIVLRGPPPELSARLAAYSGMRVEFRS